MTSAFSARRERERVLVNLVILTYLLHVELVHAHGPDFVLQSSI